MDGGLRTTLELSATLAIASGAVWSFSKVAPSLGIIDHPGGRKAHARPIPLVGGISIFLTLLAMSAFTGIMQSASYLLVALSLVIAIGLWDDVMEISPRLKFAIQIVASGVMIFGADIRLHSVGDLLGWRPIGLSVFVIPMTVFAVVGVVNSINMMDGMDGLAGSISFVALAWYALVAWSSGMQVQYSTALILCGAIAGFLLFNLRFPWQSHAKVFLGDAGSLMIGFALGWYAIDLTQGLGRTFPPIAALWIVVLPLADCVSIMTRRIMAGRSPFVADRQHLHHYLQARGFTHGQTLGLMVGLSGLFGAVGFLGWQLGVPQAALFYPFFFGFFAYHLWIQRAWKKLERRGVESIETNMLTPMLVVEPKEETANELA
jgi:UDP-GlcNAc:undecaprenyl-phosphate GlcNAc-1-phosphate transferase